MGHLTRKDRPCNSVADHLQPLLKSKLATPDVAARAGHKGTMETMTKEMSCRWTRLVGLAGADCTML